MLNHQDDKQWGHATTEVIKGADAALMGDKKEEAMVHTKKASWLWMPETRTLLAGLSKVKKRRTDSPGGHCKRTQQFFTRVKCK